MKGTLAPVLSSLLLPALFAAGAFALEIPLKQRAGGGQGGTTVGFVDMEAIFQEYPETQKAKTEYFAELASKREALASLEKELVDLREQLSVLRTTLKEMQDSLKSAPESVEASTATAETFTAASTAPAAAVAEAMRPGSLAQDIGASPGSVAAVNESLLQREKTLQEKETALEQARLNAAKDLTEFEERRSLQIMGKLYKALIQLADEQGVTVVVDKRSILYGQAAMDLTDRLRRRVRGLPDPEFDQ